MRILLALLAALCLWLPQAQAAGLVFPKLTGRVVDEANLLPPALESQLTQSLAALEAKDTTQFVVATVASLQGQDIAEYGYQLGRHWGIGQKGKNNGVLLIVAPNEREVRIEVGYGLEGTLTDAASAQIIQRIILPHFRQQDYAGGIMAGSDAVIRVLGGEALKLDAHAAQGEGEMPPLWVIVLIIVVIIILRLMGYGRGGGFAGGFGRGGGGGFSGGGGSFGGGGSSGRW